MPANPMNIIPPVPEQTAGPAWANDINDILTNIVANHNHQPAQDGGVQLTQDALNITDDLSLNGNQLINVNAIGLATETSASVSGSNRLYNEGGDLYYRDGNGAGVRITQNGGLSAASFGGISGLSGTSGAATYNAGAFIWTKDNPPNQEYATMIGGPVKIYSGNDTNPVGGVNLIAKDSMAGDLNVTFPAAAPASDRLMVMSSSGEITLPATISGDTYITNDTISGSTKLVSESVPNSKITNRTIQRYKLSNVGITADDLNAPVNVAAGTGNYVDIITIQITTYGRPLVVSFQGTPEPAYSGVSPSGVITTAAGDQFIFSRYKIEDVTGGGTLVGYFCTEKMAVNVNTAGPTIIPIVKAAQLVVPNSSVYGGSTSRTWDITLQVAQGAGTQTLSVDSGVLCAFEL